MSVTLEDPTNTCMYARTLATLAESYSVVQNIYALHDFI